MKKKWSNVQCPVCSVQSEKKGGEKPQRIKEDVLWTARARASVTMWDGRGGAGRPKGQNSELLNSELWTRTECFLSCLGLSWLRQVCFRCTPRIVFRGGANGFHFHFQGSGVCKND